MGIANVVNACVHIQNASRARLSLTSIPNLKYNLLFSLALHRSGLVSSVTCAGPHPPSPEDLLTFEAEPVTTAEVASRRIWLGLKYVNNEPVMWNVKGVSKPRQPITLQLPGLNRVASGLGSGYVGGLKMGECMFVATSLGVLEIREALERKVGGLVLARVSPTHRIEEVTWAEQI
ncbi:ribosomal protein S8 [Mycena maculata]|uniref:Ribosomal protein S8 n=1 Tax=Mycena maculata TaxID=230809 RepID=A0AAD7NH12_9AGAR|nr:ribosomal protein S8 [Mycena maculata]